MTWSEGRERRRNGPLELRYRRLLAAYPPVHRHTYEGEMIAVLMAGSRPGQRFPSPADAVNLVFTGLRARLGGRTPLAGDSAWRDAAAVVGLLGAVVLAAVPARRLSDGLYLMATGDPMRAYAIEGLLLLDVALRAVLWLAVAVAAVAGARRPSAGLAVLAGLAEGALLAAWSARDSHRILGQSWLPVLTVLVVGSLFVAVRGRTAATVLGRRGVGWATGAAILVVTSDYVGTWSIVPMHLTASITLGGVSLPSPLRLAAALLLLRALWSLHPPVRRRVLIAAVPVLLTPALTDALSRAPERGYGMGPVQGAVLVAGLLSATFWSTVALHRWERRRERVVPAAGDADAD